MEYLKLVFSEEGYLEQCPLASVGKLSDYLLVSKVEFDLYFYFLLACMVWFRDVFTHVIAGSDGYTDPCALYHLFNLVDICS